MTAAPDRFAIILCGKRVIDLVHRRLPGRDFAAHSTHCTKHGEHVNSIGFILEGVSDTYWNNELHRLRRRRDAALGRAIIERFQTLGEN